MKFLATLLLLLSISVQAKECDQDEKKFCSGVDHGKGQLAKCLDDYQGQLSPGCAKELKEFKANTEKKNPCYADLADFCATIPSDNRKLEYCLLKNESRLGNKCSEDFKKNKPNIIVKDVCAQDIVNNCYSTLTEPEAATTRCMIRNRTKLSGFCQKNVDKKIAEIKKINPCFDETEKYCPAPSSFVDIHDCMEKKINVLTPNCKKVVQAEVDREKKNPCYMDLRRHCKSGLTSTQQHHCLALNEKELSNSCRQFRVTESQKLKKMVDLCEKDRLQFCPKAPFKNGMVLKCLKENAVKLTPACKALL